MRILMLLTFALMLAACGRNDDLPAQPAEHQPAPTTDRAQELYRQAEGAVARRDYPAATLLLEQAAELAPSDWQVQARLGHVYKQQQRWAEALSQFEIAARLAQGNDRNLLQGRMAVCSYRLARRAYAAGEHKLALEHVRDGLQWRPADAALNLLLGYIQFHRQDYAEAETAFEFAAELLTGETRHEAILWLAHARFRQEKFEPALEGYTRLIDENFTGEDVFGWRAYALYSLGRYDEARRDFLRATEYATNPEKRAEFNEAAAALAQEQE